MVRVKFDINNDVLLFNNKKLSKLACYIHWDADLKNDSGELLRSVMIDISGFNIQEFVEVDFKENLDGIYPAVKTVLQNGKVKTITLTFSKPAKLVGHGKFQMSIADIVLTEAAYQSKAINVDAQITTIVGSKNVKKEKTSCSLTFDRVVNILDRFLAEPTLAHQYDALKLTWENDDINEVTFDNANTAKKRYVVMAGKRFFEIPLMVVLRDLGQLTNIDETKERCQLTVYPSASSDIGEPISYIEYKKKINILKHNMWYAHRIDPAKTIIDIIDVECDGKIWAIAHNPQSNFLEIWYKEDSLEWKDCNISIDWTNLKLKMDNQIKLTDLKNYNIDLKAYLPPAVVIKEEVNYKLYFLGGSKIEGKIPLDTVFSLTFKLASDSSNDTGIARSLTEDVRPSFPARAGHCVTVLDFNNQTNCIWVLGGMTGQAGLDDVWVFNREKWIQIETKKYFKSRCLFCTTIHLTGNLEKEMWVVGGFDFFGGQAVNEMLRYFKNADSQWVWEVVCGASGQPAVAPIDNKKRNTIAITSVSGSNGNNFLNFLAIYDDSKSYLGKLEYADSYGDGARKYFKFSPGQIHQYEFAGGGWSDTPNGMEGLNNYYVKTIGHKGSIWLMAFRKKARQAHISNLYYLRPEQLY